MNRFAENGRKKEIERVREREEVCDLKMKMMRRGEWRKKTSSSSHHFFFSVILSLSFSPPFSLFFFLSGGLLWVNEWDTSLSKSARLSCCYCCENDAKESSPSHSLSPSLSPFFSRSISPYFYFFLLFIIPSLFLSLSLTHPRRCWKEGGSFLSHCISLPVMKTSPLLFWQDISSYDYRQ